MKSNNLQFTFSIAQAAKLIRFPGGRHKFYTWLRQKQYILEDNFPSQKVIDLQWFVIKGSFHNEESFSQTMAIPRVTIKGLAALERIVKNEFPICKPCK